MLNKKQAQRLSYALLLMAVIAAGAGLVLYSLKQNINLFLTPTEALEQRLPSDHTFRLGGQVKPGSIIREKNSLTVKFTLTDMNQEVLVSYTGVLPDLFKEGNGAIAEGHWNGHEFVATQILAKHDENYKPQAMEKIYKK